MIKSLNISGTKSINSRLFFLRILSRTRVGKDCPCPSLALKKVNDTEGGTPLRHWNRDSGSVNYLQYIIFSLLPPYGWCVRNVSDELTTHSRFNLRL